jgi:hypothetical protein
MTLVASPREQWPDLAIEVGIGGEQRAAEGEADENQKRVLKRHGESAAGNSRHGASSQSSG